MKESTGLPGLLQTQVAGLQIPCRLILEFLFRHALAGPADSVCGLSAALTGNSPAKGLGTWSKISGPGNVNFIPTIHSPSVMANIPAGDEGQYIFEWRITSGSCPPKADSTLIYFKPMPAVPAANDVQRCGPGSCCSDSYCWSQWGCGTLVSEWFRRCPAFFGKQLYNSGHQQQYGLLGGQL